MLEQTLRCLAAFGRLVVLGVANGHSGTLSPASLDRLLYAPAPSQSLVSFNVGSYFTGRPAAALKELVDTILSGRIDVPGCWPLLVNQPNK